MAHAFTAAAAAPALLAALYTGSHPALAHTDATVAEQDRSAATATALKQEVIQIVATAATSDRLRLNVAGEPGVRFRLLAGAPGGERSVLPGTEGVLDAGGFASLEFDAPDLDDAEYEAQTSDGADFRGEIRTSTEPFRLQRRDGEWLVADGGNNDWPKTPTGTAGVRGKPSGD